MAGYSSEAVTLAALVVAAAFKVLFGAVTQKNRRQKMVKVGTVTQLNCYPVKSCRGVTVEGAMCTRMGLMTGHVKDRHWLVVRSNGDFVTQRQASKMALIQTKVGVRDLVLDAPGMPTLTLPIHPSTDRHNVIKCRVWESRMEGLDCGDDAAYWMSTYLRLQGLRMVFSAPDLLRQDLSVTKLGKSWEVPGVQFGDQAAFSDFCGYLIATEASLDAVNDKLTDKVKMNRFRPNIVVGGCAAFDEDNWTVVQIGEEATLRLHDPCTRCLLTTVNPDTGERDPNSEPLQTLKAMRCFPRYGPSPLFGVNASVEVEGGIRIGDPVFAITK